MLTKFAGKMKAAVAVSGLLLASCGLPGCGKILDGLDGRTSSQGGKIDATPGTFTHVYQATLSTACVQCHVPGSDGGDHLDFSDKGSAYRTLLGGAVSGHSSATICGGLKLIEPGVPRDSYLAAVLFAEYNAIGFGGVPECKPYSVHLEDQNLSDTEKSSILSWIRNGARND